MSDEQTSSRPHLEVVAGNPTPEELAAVVTVLAAATLEARTASPTERTDLPRSGGWKSYWRTVRNPVRPGRDAWAHPLR